MEGDTGVDIRGLDDLVRKLAHLPADLREKVLRPALRAGGALVRDAIKPNVPRLRKATRYRTPGTVARAVSLRDSKRDAAAGDVGVFVNVKPAKGIYRSAKSPVDPYYWRWIQFGTQKMAGRDYLQYGVAQLSAARELIEKRVEAYLRKLESSSGAGL